MGNCLKTQLKENVNAFLPIMGDLAITIKNPSNFKVVAKKDTYNVTVRAKNAILYALDVNGLKTGEPVSSLTISANGFGVADGTIGETVYLSDAAFITELYLKGCFTNLISCTSIISITMVDSLCAKKLPDVSEPADRIVDISGTAERSINLNELEPSDMYATLQCSWRSSYVIVLDVTEQWCREHSNIVNVLFGNQLIYGDVKYLGLTNVKWITFGYNNESSSLHGTVEEFVQYKRSAGFTEGYSTFQYEAGRVTFNGNQLTTDGGGGAFFEWTANTITHNGVTINV